MDFSYIVQSFQNSFPAAAYFALYLVWVAATFALGLACYRSKSKINQELPSFFLALPVAAAALFFIHLGADLYRTVILVQMSLAITLVCVQCYYWHLKAVMSFGKDSYLSRSDRILSNAEIADYQLRRRTCEYARDILIGVIFGLFAGSHVFDDGLAPMLLVAVLLFIVDVHTDVVNGRMNEDAVTTVLGRRRQVNGICIVVFIGYLVGCAAGLMFGEEPTVLCTLIGLGLLVQALVLRWLALSRKSQASFA